MIIVSQDKLKIINFDNIDSVRVDANLIYAFKNKEKFWIATYNTMNRAKEVLEMIVKFYGRLDLEKQEREIDEAIAITLLRDKSVFEMPKE